MAKPESSAISIDLPKLRRAFLRSEQIAHHMPEMRDDFSCRAADSAWPHHAVVADDEDTPAGAATVLVPLEEADAGEDKVAIVADDDTEIEAVDDTFLEEEEEDAMSDQQFGDLIDGEIGDEEER